MNGNLSRVTNFLEYALVGIIFFFFQKTGLYIFCYFVNVLYIFLFSEKFYKNRFCTFFVSLLTFYTFTF